QLRVPPCRGQSCQTGYPVAPRDIRQPRHGAWNLTVSNSTVWNSTVSMSTVSRSPCWGPSGPPNALGERPRAEWPLLAGRALLLGERLQRHCGGVACEQALANLSLGEHFGDFRHGLDVGQLFAARDHQPDDDAGRFAVEGLERNPGRIQAQ